MSILGIKTIRDSLTLSEYMDARTLFEGLKVIEPEQPMQIALLYRIGFIEGIRAERTKRHRSEYKALPSLIFEGGIIRPFNKDSDGELITARFKGICQEYGVKVTSIEPEDARHNIDIVCKDRILFFVGDMDITRLVNALWKLPQALEKSKDSGFIIFNENGIPEDWRKGGVPND